MNFEVFAFQAVPEPSSSGSVQPAPGAPAEPGAAPPSGFGMVTPLLILIPFIAILFFQSRSQAKKQETTIAGLKSGDRVLTQSGLVGRLLAIEGRYAKLELPPSGTKITVLRTSLIGRDTEGETAPAKGADKSKPSKTTTD